MNKLFIKTTGNPDKGWKYQLLFLRFFFSASVAVAQNSNMPENYEVRFYEEVNYTGRFEEIILTSVADTKNHSITELNNRISSVKVPKGFVVILYENDDGKKGKSIELMEDCPDLSELGWKNKTSYTSVFFSVKPGGRYVKTKKVNGKTIPGHWEAAAVPLKKPKNK